MSTLFDKNNSIAIKILGYEFPDASSTWDANWLNIEIEVKLIKTDQLWKAIAPALTTGDVEKLADWISKIAENRKTTKHLWFTENNIEITRTNKTLEIKLGSEFYNPKMKETASFLITPTKKTLREFSASLLEQLKPFPSRIDFYK